VIEKKFAYEEPKQDLSIRISAHAKYSDFNLHEWIRKRFKIRSGDRLWDLGCGNGNYTRLFWDFVQPSGVILGMDKNHTLIDEARAKHAELSKENVRYIVHNFDEAFPDSGMSYEWVFAIYSLYYTENSLKILQSVRDRLVSGGSFVVIGPAPENTKDLMEFNFRLTGKKPGKEHIERIERIENEFRPLFVKLFSQERVTYEVIDSIMRFPDVESYGEYYMSTLLWRESIKEFSDGKIVSIKEEMKKQISLPVQIKKQMSCLVGCVE